MLKASDLSPSPLAPPLAPLPLMVARGKNKMEFTPSPPTGGEGGRRQGEGATLKRYRIVNFAVSN